RYYDSNGRLFSILKANDRGGYNYETLASSETEVPTRSFALRDYDGQVVKATLRLEESVSALGEGRWRWLSLFVSHRVRRRFDISFSSETGPEKGSWKGGVVGTSIAVLDATETHEEAIR